MLVADRAGFVEAHGCWSEQQYADAAQLRRVMDELGIELVRVCFADQFGVVRGKTITRAALPGVLRSGVNVPSSLLLKDTSGRSSYSVFEQIEVAGHRGFAGVGDVVVVPDPSTFRVLPWSPRTAMVLSDLRYPDGREVPLCSRGVLRRVLSRLADRDLALVVGPELEFHVFAREDRAMHPDRVGSPGRPGAATPVRPLSAGAQLLHMEGLDRCDDLVEQLNETLTMFDLPLRSIEMEFGANQFEVTLEAGDAQRVADEVLLCRTAIKQICARRGLHATFMSRPLGVRSASTGWHLHQSLLDGTGEPAFPTDASADTVLSSAGRAWLAGLLAHADAASAFTTPTVNGYKRYQPQSLAPDRVVWGLDNRGAMIRVIGRPGDPATRLENRSGEPAANPYLYVAAQVVSGLDGMDRGLDPGPPTESPYLDDRPRLPVTLGDAIDALDASAVFRRALSDDYVDWYVHLKRAEFRRYLDEVSDWEQREYFDLL